MSTPELDRIRTILLGLPEVNERLSHGAPTFFLRDKRPLCYFHGSDFASDERISIWCPGGPGVQEELVAANPTTFFAPTPSSSGVFASWIVAFLDTDDVDWNEITEVIHDAYRLIAPKKLSKLLDED